MEAIDALQKANHEFASRLAAVGPEHWTLQTPCPDWDVRGLVNHMLLGTRMTIQVLDGMPREEVIAALDDDLMSGSEDPTADFLGLADQVVERFSGPHGLDGIVAHPAGDFPRSIFVGFRVTDAAVHAWDLASAIGADTTLDGDLVQFLWDDAQPRRELLIASGMFGEGASGKLEDTSPLQVRYLDLLGRRPQTA